MNSTQLDRICSLAMWSWVVAATGCGDNADRAGTPAPELDAAPGAPDAPPPPLSGPTKIAIASGEVQGGVEGTSRQFLGIPYARPPVGELRWKAPQPADPWTAPRDATQFGKRCAQITSAVLQNAASTDEDCLSLNVWTPLFPPPAPLPVMVWIHGGGNVNGSTAEPVPFLRTGAFYSGAHLAGDHGVIVVSMNYRLGLFGFFAHPALAAEGAGAAQGNQGLLDQRLALQWVKDNIAAFGGDPAKVTIFGESAGSQDVCLHVASPGSIPLFRAAIGESGGCTTRQPTQREGAQVATDVATELGCVGADADVLACLRAKPAADLLASDAVKARLAGDGSPGSFAPTLDGDGGVIPDQPRTLYKAGKIAQIPVLLGSNTDEGTLFVGGVQLASQDDYAAALTAQYGTLEGTLEGLYDPTKEFASAPPNPFLAAYARVIGDSTLTCTTFDTASRAAAAGNTVYLYNFDIPVASAFDPPGGHLGATHGSELTSVFGTAPALSAEAASASELIQRYWTNFARTGDPNGSGDPAWPVFTSTMNVRLNLAPVPATKLDFRKAQCAFWQLVYGNAFGDNPTAR